jgi:hypothetical protein
MDILTLDCWIYGEDVGRTFRVKVPTTGVVYDLKKAIRNKKPVYFRNVDAKDLDLYLFRIPDDDERLQDELAQWTLHGKSCVGARLKLSQVFPNSDLANNETYLIIANVPGLRACLFSYYVALLMVVDLLRLPGHFPRHDA